MAKKTIHYDLDIRGQLLSNGVPVDAFSSAAPMVEILYSDLVTLRDNAQLIPGRQYRITDYVTEVDV